MKSLSNKPLAIFKSPLYSCAFKLTTMLQFVYEIGMGKKKTKVKEGYTAIGKHIIKGKRETNRKS